MSHRGAQQVLGQWAGSNFLHHKLTAGIRHANTNVNKVHIITFHVRGLDIKNSKTRQIDNSFSLVELDVRVLVLVWFVIGYRLFQVSRPLTQDRYHNLHEFRRSFFLSTLNHTNLSPTATLSVPDVLSQQNSLQPRNWSICSFIHPSEFSQTTRTTVPLIFLVGCFGGHSIVLLLFPRPARICPPDSNCSRTPPPAEDTHGPL